MIKSSHGEMYLMGGVSSFGGGGLSQSALRDFEAKKSNEISRVCHRHFSEFVDSVEDLMKMKTDFISLRDQVKLDLCSFGRG